MKLELWQAVGLLWIGLCVVGSVLVSYADVERDRRQRRVILKRLEDGALTEVPAPAELLNARGACQCSSCLFPNQVKW